MKKIMNPVTVLILALILSGCSSKTAYRKISVEEYQSKMKAGWLGQMAGVGWGAPTEFRYTARIIPESDVPAWKPEMINQHYQDDIYVEMTFLKTLEDYGFDVSIRQTGIDFANSRYMLWHANKNGRHNLRAGIAPPYSGHPQFNAHADDIDYQIEADYSGLIAPGLPQTVVDLGEKFGRLMNYGDGLYGGQFVGAMYAEAFFETDILQIIEAGLRAIPSESQYAEAIRDVMNWHQTYPENWKKTWQLIENKYNLDPDYRRFSCSGADASFNIDAKINGAYIVMGLLYGDGDMDKTIIISMRCGQDSDCNPSNAGGILATSLGLENLPDKFKTGIDDTTKFSYTAYTFPALLNVCEKLSREAVIHAGGRIDKKSGKPAEYVIPIQVPEPTPLEQCWEAREITEDVHFSKQEMAKILRKIRSPEEFVSVWQVAGPFSKEGVEGIDLFDVKFIPETEMSYSDWKYLPIGENGLRANEINLAKYFGTENCVAYLKTNIWIENSQNVLFELGSDDGIKVWLNDQLVHTNNVERGHEAGQDIVEVCLNQGWNKVLIKITQGVGGWAASLAVTDLDHKVINGLKYRKK
ncbi:MAG: ADP-ribosylglycohydrolase family protein [Candidatus Marinimicrobia bacterium]|nr:ADP-ribosylglycohydrolase family protein [Candidatus Neomarinimicrobiota bacterium]